jgi:hypothetical protein
MNEKRVMKRQSAMAFAVGVGFGLVFLLVLLASVTIAEHLYPPPPDVFLWLFPVMLGAGFAAVISGLLCGSGSALMLRRLVGETGPIRMKPIALMSLIWMVIPPLAFFAAGHFGSPPLNVLIPMAASLCGWAMIAFTKIYVASCANDADQIVGPKQRASSDHD